jgi:heterodisulfide reductase subunit B
VVEYKEIAEWLDLNCYHPDYKNEEYSREVQLIRKKLNPILEKAGMKREEINKMIIAKKNLGYKILPID